jgi:hypothetical protein
MCSCEDLLVVWNFFWATYVIVLVIVLVFLFVKTIRD